MIVYGMTMTYRSIGCTFGMDIKQFEPLKDQYYTDDSVIVGIDDNLDNA